MEAAARLHGIGVVADCSGVEAAWRRRWGGVDAALLLSAG